MKRLAMAYCCDMPWDSMAGSDRVRHCPSCDRDVHDLSAIREAEAQILMVFGGAGGICTRFTCNERGEIVHAQDPPASALVRSSLRAGAVAVAVGAAVAVGCGPARPSPAHASIAAPVSSAAAPAHTLAPATTPVSAAAASPNASVPAEGSAAIATPSPAEAVSPSAPSRLAVAAEPSTIDSDGDTITDRDDACPTEPGKASPEPSKHGCPRPVVVVTMGVSIVHHVRFSAGGRAIGREARTVLEQVARVMKENPQITRVAVTGHASMGEHNPKKLGEDRAKAALGVLVAEGVDPGRFVIESAGADAPLAPNATEADRAKNRRIEFRILEQEAASCPMPADPRQGGF